MISRNLFCISVVSISYLDLSWQNLNTHLQFLPNQLSLVFKVVEKSAKGKHRICTLAVFARAF